MAISLGQIQFGETDAKHEVFTQAREGSYVLLNAFQMPPSVKFEQLLSGAKFFISGLKGTGKTSLILYLQNYLETAGGTTHIVLFKSKLTEPERQRLSPIKDITAFIDQDRIRFEQDYKINWLWFVIGELIRLIEPQDVAEGKDHLHDLKIITGTDKPGSRSMFSGLQLTKIKASVESALKAGPFKTSVKAEIEAISSTKEDQFIHIVDICERLLYKIKLNPGRIKALFFDELELFIGKIDQKDRDLFLIRDLLYVVSRINQGFGADGAAIRVYASVRSEVMFEINRLDPEIERDVRDFGVSIDWHGTNQTPNQSILRIVESKIEHAEFDETGSSSGNVWDVYFDKEISGKQCKNYLLDISMFKPRTLVILLSSISKQFPQNFRVTTDIVRAVETTFSNEMWREVEEELRTSYDASSVSAIKSSLRGLPIRSTLENIEQHIFRYAQKDDLIRKILGTHSSIKTLLETLYRVGAIGTRAVGGETGQHTVRDAWVFRHVYEPQFGDAIIFHSSLRKALQLT